MMLLKNMLQALAPFYGECPMKEVDNNWVLECTDSWRSLAYTNPENQDISLNYLHYLVQ